MALAVVVSLASSTVALAGAPDAKKKPKGPKVVANDACTMLWDTRVEAAFGGPVTIVPGATLVGSDGCVASVGVDNATPPGGILQAFQEFPTLLSGNRSARAAVEDRRAGDVLSDDVVTDLEKVGKGGYVNRTKGTITVVATKKFAFTLQWARAGDEAITDADRTALTALAKNVVARLKG